MPWNRINSLSAECPECSSTISFVSTPKVGQIVYCALCGTRLEVAYLQPIMLDYVDDGLPPDHDRFEIEGYDYDDEI